MNSLILQGSYHVVIYEHLTVYVCWGISDSATAFIVANIASMIKIIV